MEVEAREGEGVQSATRARWARAALALGGGAALCVAVAGLVPPHPEGGALYLWKGVAPPSRMVLQQAPPPAFTANEEKVLKGGTASTLDIIQEALGTLPPLLPAFRSPANSPPLPSPLLLFLTLLLTPLALTRRRSIGRTPSHGRRPRPSDAPSPPPARMEGGDARGS